MRQRRFVTDAPAEKKIFITEQDFERLENIFSSFIPTEERYSKIRDFLKSAIAFKFKEVSRQEIRFLTDQDISSSFMKLKNAGANERICSLVKEILEDLRAAEDNLSVLNEKETINKFRRLKNLLEKDDEV